jgi:hypothetical protein
MSLMLKINLDLLEEEPLLQVMNFLCFFIITFCLRVIYKK